MCYYNSYHNPQSLQFDGKDISPLEFNRAVVNGFDYPEWPVIYKNSITGEYENALMEWGYLPNNLKTGDDVAKFRQEFTTLNAVSEDMFDSMYKDSIHNRCIVLSSGFYERKHVKRYSKSGNVLKDTIKVPYHIGLKGQSYFYMAGVYNLWVYDDTVDVTPTFTILTTAATTNKTIAEIHNAIDPKTNQPKRRMPVILPEELAARWLDPNLTIEEMKEIVKYQVSDLITEAHEVQNDFLTCDDPKRPVTAEDRGNLLF